VLYKKQLSKEQALPKLKHFCAYQERCHTEVVEKLYQLGVWKREHGEILAALIEEDYLNEERFAVAFAGGKFRIKDWGRVKIKYELRQKMVSEYCIKKALQQIEDDLYQVKADKLAAKKYASLKNGQWMLRKKKTFHYMQQRGFEPDIIHQAIGKAIIAQQKTENPSSRLRKNK
jgi:regulatory protein